MTTVIMFIAWMVGAQAQVAKASQPSACVEALAAGPSGSAGDMCAGEEQVRLAQVATREADRIQRLTLAAQYYRRAAIAAVNSTDKGRALEALAGLYDPTHLGEPDLMEQVLRELAVLSPTDLSPVFRLARSQEDRGLIDAAESTLLAARHQRPDMIEPYQMLARFYARRATSFHQAAEAQSAPKRASGLGEPDEQGVYRIGASVDPPRRLDRAVYPPEALAAGIQGSVTLEVVVSERGEVVDASVIRSVPLLDEEALRTVGTWRFLPTFVNGRPVPVRMNVTVNFTTP